MAKNQRQFKGWSHALSSEGSTVETETRRSRRSRKEEDVKLVLTREDDGLEVKAGDCVLVDQQDRTDVAIIREISFGINNFIEMKVLWFLKASSVPLKDEQAGGEIKQEELAENDLLITAVQSEIYVTEIIDLAHVLSKEEFKSISIDESNKDTTFLCQRGYDESTEKFSNLFNWRELQQLCVQDHSIFLQQIKDLVVPPSIKSRTASANPSPRKPKRVVKYKEESSEESDVYESASELFDASDEEQQDEDSQDEELSDDPKPKLSRPKRKSKATSTPRKRRTRKSEEPPSEMIPSLPTRSTLNFGENSDNEEDLQTPIFKQARKRLHASAKLRSLPCREKEFHQIYQSLEDSVESQIGTCIYVSGTPGTGKTATIREVVKQMVQAYVDKGDESAFDYLEINGLKLISPQSSYEVLWEKISGERVSASNAAILLDEYFQRKDKSRKPLIVLMDEVDQIVTKTQTVMYNFFNWPTYLESKLVVIAVANTMDLPERLLTNKISSRLGLRRLQFPGYDYVQLAEIIKHRLEDLEKLNSGKLIIKKDAIEFAARKVASVSGDARRALIICRRAIEIAEWEFFKTHKEDAEDEVYTVQIKHIMKLVNETTNSPVSHFLQSLSFVAKLFIACLLMRKKKSGLLENTLDSIIDEMDRVIAMLTSSSLLKELQKERIDLKKMLYGPDRVNLRIEGFTYVVQELVESGILLQQNSRGERLSLVKLNVGDDEIINVFKRDENLQNIAGF